MNITGTSNALLSRKISLDPSYISRLRTGKRNPVRDKSVIENMARHFVRNSVSDYQIEILAKIVGFNYLDSDEDQRIDLLYVYLTDNTKEYKLDKSLTNVYTSFNSTVPSKQSLKSLSETYFGLSGKKRAIERLVSEVVDTNKTTNLMIFSDEPTDWIFDDKNFVKRLFELLKQVLKKGHKIKIIHSPARHLDEALAFLTHWIPLYMTGEVTQHYYPKVRDGLFGRTFAVAKGAAAMVSSSIASIASIDSPVPVFYTNEEKVISYHIDEFNFLISKCNPLIDIYTYQNSPNLFAFLEEFDKINSDTAVSTVSLSQFTMPTELLLEKLDKIKGVDRKLKPFYIKRRLYFEKLLSKNRYCEVIPVLDPKDVAVGKVVVDFPNVLVNQFVYYTKKEYIEHLRNILRLSYTHENFHFILGRDLAKHHLTFYLKENHGALISDTLTKASVVFSTFQNRLTTVLYDYLIHLLKSEFHETNCIETQQQKLKDYIKVIETTERKTV